MSSLGDMNKECAMRLAHVVDQYNNAIGKECAMARMLRGNKSVLHDRFIVCDDDIWAVGASFNELGARASVIYKIPYEAGLVIIQNSKNGGVMIMSQSMYITCHCLQR